MFQRHGQVLCRVREDIFYISVVWQGRHPFVCPYDHVACVFTVSTYFLGYRYPSERLDVMGAGGVLGTSVACL